MVNLEVVRKITTCDGRIWLTEKYRSAVFVDFFYLPVANQVPDKEIGFYGAYLFDKKIVILVLKMELRNFCYEGL